MKISLTEDLAEFVKREVASGRYASESEVVCQALRLMAQMEQGEADKLHWLQEAWQQGVASGDAGRIDFAELKREARLRLATRPSG